MAETNSDHDDSIDDIKEVRGNKVWFEENEEKFINLLEEEVLKRNRSITTLTKEAWRNVQTKLNESIGKKYTTN